MASHKTFPREDVYTCITDRIVADLEQGVRPWMKPWSAGNLKDRITRPCRHNGEPYSGINILLLWSEAVEKGYASATWMTFRQANELGGHVRKGETGATVVYSDRIRKTETNARGEEEERAIPFLKSYAVFNIEQIEGLPDPFLTKPHPILDSTQRIERAERFFAATGADIRHGGAMAAYAIGPDYIQLPPFECFRDPESYYAALAHEGIHWTRHPSRLNRDMGRQRFGDEGYAREECVAELGSAFLCADLGLALEPREDHAAYIASWLKHLKDDRRFIFSAASYAHRAVEFLHTLQPANDKRAEGPE